MKILDGGFYQSSISPFRIIKEPRLVLHVRIKTYPIADTKKHRCIRTQRYKCCPPERHHDHEYCVSQFNVLHGKYSKSSWLQYAVVAPWCTKWWWWLKWFKWFIGSPVGAADEWYQSFGCCEWWYSKWWLWWPTSIGEFDAVGDVAWWCDPKYGDVFAVIALLPVNGDLLCCEWCSDLIDSGVCVLCEWFSPKRDGGVCVPPVIILDEVESSSPSLSYVCVGDFSPKLPCI